MHDHGRHHGHLGYGTSGRSLRCAALLAAMPEGIWELVCHPGYNDRDLDQVTTRLRATRDVEREALLAVFATPEGELATSAPELIH